MFDNLSNRFEGIFKRIRGKGRLTEADVDEVLKEIRAALLEADVNVSVARNVVARIREGAIGIEQSKALDPSQQVVKLVNAELTAILGGETLKITYASKPPTVVLMAGLQGSGKTTNSAKLARWFKSQGRHPLLVGADLQRPAAVEQLRTLGNQIDVPVFSEPGDPVATATKGLAEARRLGKDVLIVDTAGRLAIDGEMMEQIRRISDSIEPDYTFLVIDAMTGQDAVSVAEAFHATLAIDPAVDRRLGNGTRACKPGRQRERRRAEAAWSHAASAMPWWRSSASSEGLRPRKATKESMAGRLPPTPRTSSRKRAPVRALSTPSSSNAA